MNRRSIFAGLGVGFAAVVASAVSAISGERRTPMIQGVAMELKQCTTLRSYAAQPLPETDLLEIDIDDGSLLTDVARSLVVCVLNGQILEHCISANAVTGEATCHEYIDGKETGRKVCFQNGTVQILFKNQTAHNKYMEQANKRLYREEDVVGDTVNIKLLPMPVNYGWDSPVRIMLKAKFGNE